MLRNKQGTALIFKDTHYSFENILRHAGAYSKKIDHLHPEKVMIFSENRPEWIFAFYAAWNVSATVVPADPMSSASEIAYIANDSRPAVIYYSREKETIVKEALKTTNYNPELFLLDDLGHIEADETPPDIIPNDENDTAVIIYTSGTTGSPKGVMLTYKNLYANMKSVSHDIPIYKPGERVMILLPLHHIFPLLGSLIVVMYAGATSVMSPAMTNEHIIGTLQKHKVTIIIGVPRLYSMIRKGIMDKIKANKAAKAMFAVARTFQSRAFSKRIFNTIHKKFGGELKYMVCGGAPLDPEVAKDYKTLGFEMLEGYGMTESSPMISFTRPGKWKIGAAGQLMPGVEVEIIDGEITAKGDNIMKGYYNRPDETNEVLKEGRLYTGDLGYVDKNEYLYITGRKKEIIVLSSGKNINPNYLESDIEEKVDGLEEVAVLQYNDRLHALIRPNAQFFKDKTKELMEEFFRKQLKLKYNSLVASYKRIGKFTIIEQELPRTRLGKLRRFKLEDLLHAPAPATPKGGNTQQADFEELKVIRSFIEDQKSIEVSPDDHLEFDIGMDSLDKVSLQTFLENSFGVKINTEKFMHFPSVAKLAEYIKEKKSKFSIENINWSDILKEHKPVSLPRSSFFGQMVMKFSKYFFKVYFRLTYSGMHNLPREACIIAPNHQSFFDGFFVASLLKRKIYKNTVFYAKKKHLNNKFLQYIAKNNNIVIVDVDNELKSSIQKLAAALKQNKNIIIFPEGTRTQTGNLGPFKDMFAILSRELKVPVVPVAIHGAYNALPRGAKFPKPFTKVHIDFKQPVYPQNHDYKSLNQAVRKRILEAAG